MFTHLFIHRHHQKFEQITIEHLHILPNNFYYMCEPVQFEQQTQIDAFYWLILIKGNKEEKYKEKGEIF